MLSEHRRGKVKAIEEAFASCTGDVLIFLDSDIVIKDQDIVSKTAAEIEGYDMLEMKKSVVVEGPAFEHRLLRIRRFQRRQLDDGEEDEEDPGRQRGGLRHDQGGL